MSQRNWKIVVNWAGSREDQQQGNIRAKAIVVVCAFLSISLHVFTYYFLMPPTLAMKGGGSTDRNSAIDKIPQSLVVQILMDRTKPAISPITNSIPTEIAETKISTSQEATTEKINNGSEGLSIHHSLHDLSKQPELVGGAPNFVEFPLERMPSGSLLLRLIIDRFGHVSSVTSLRSTLPREIEGQIVMQFYRATYQPGEIDGIPVDSEMYVYAQI